MRTTIVLERNAQGEWDEALGRIDVSHDAPLSDEAIEAFRELARVARDRLDSPKPHPPRDRGEAAAVNGLTAVGQEDTPSS